MDLHKTIPPFSKKLIEDKIREELYRMREIVLQHGGSPELFIKAQRFEEQLAILIKREVLRFAENTLQENILKSEE